jgi:hypothetical protein
MTRKREDMVGHRQQDRDATLAVFYLLRGGKRELMHLPVVGDKRRVRRGMVFTSGLH